LRTVVAVDPGWIKQQEAEKIYFIKMDIRGIGLGCMEWTRLTEDCEQGRALVKRAINFRFP
jgi:hypothetical protein